MNRTNNPKEYLYYSLLEDYREEFASVDANLYEEIDSRNIYNENYSNNFAMPPLYFDTDDYLSWFKEPSL
jgi:hypothetical protein